VLQGEREMAADNKTLAKFELVGIPPAPRGVPQIEVTFDIDANGIVGVSAKDLGTGKSQDIKITASSGLTEKEIQSMISDAEQHRDEDVQRKRLAEITNQGSTLLYTTQNSLQEFQDKIKDEDRDKILEAIETLKTALEQKSEVDIENAITKLRSYSEIFSRLIYG
jgi:molecular chaperone DnaK